MTGWREANTPPVRGEVIGSVVTSGLAACDVPGTGRSQMVAAVKGGGYYKGGGMCKLMVVLWQNAGL